MKMFYVKLSDDFFNSRQLKRLERQENGHSLVLLLIHLLSDTKNTNGVLIDDMGAEWAALDAESISAEHPSFSVEFVGSALQRFLAMGLLVRRDDGFLSFADYDSATCTYNAKKQKRYRERLKDKENSNDDGNDVTNDDGNDVTNNVPKSYSHSHSHSHNHSQSDSNKQNHHHHPAENTAKTDDDDDSICGISRTEFDELTQGLSQYDKLDLIERVKQYKPQNPRNYIRKAAENAAKTLADNPALHYEQRGSGAAMVPMVWDDLGKHSSSEREPMPDDWGKDLFVDLDKYVSEREPMPDDWGEDDTPPF